jgi:tRNA (adenine22-N1)-methyltransferase
MNSSRRGERSLSLRLKKLHSFYSNEKHVWDIGCDHGHLGLSFYDRNEVKSIHLVDPSGSVIDVLESKFKDSYITKVALLKKEGQKLNITSSSNCIFIAGMGGKEIGEIVTHLLPMLDESSTFVISPHRKILELRSILHCLPLTLLREEVIVEDNQYYQILCMRPGDQGRKISKFGEDIFRGETGERYRQLQMETFSTHRDDLSQQYSEFLKVHKSLISTDNG